MGQFLDIWDIWEIWDKWEHCSSTREHIATFICSSVFSKQNSCSLLHKFQIKTFGNEIPSNLACTRNFIKKKSKELPPQVNH
jgi:hypothetical protein